MVRPKGADKGYSRVQQKTPHFPPLQGDLGAARLIFQTCDLLFHTPLKDTPTFRLGENKITHWGIIVQYEKYLEESPGGCSENSS